MKHSLSILRETTSVALLGLAVVLACGCATTSKSNSMLLRASRRAGDRLAKDSATCLVPGEGSVIVASLVNVNDMTDSSAFGRIVSEQIASTLSQRHMMPVTEVKLRENIFLKEKAGEFLLSREVMSLSKQHAAQAVLVGTYAVGNQGVYVSVRMVCPESNRLLSSYDYSVPFDMNVRTLLGYKRIHRPGWWSRLWGDKDVWSKESRDYYRFYPDYL